MTESGTTSQEAGVESCVREPHPARAAHPDFEQWFETEFDYVWNALRRLGVREADVEDLVHETFLRVHRQRATYDPDRPLRPWLFAFAFRVAAEFRRLSRNRLEVPGLPEGTPGSSPNAEEELVRRQDRNRVLAALESVDWDRRAVFVAIEIHEHTAPEVAEALGIPLNTVYSRLRLAREEFTAALRRQDSRERRAR